LILKAVKDKISGVYLMAQGNVGRKMGFETLERAGIKK